MDPEKVFRNFVLSDRDGDCLLGHRWGESHVICERAKLYQLIEYSYRLGQQSVNKGEACPTE
uniref:Uncharacterized protein n=1 Tax=viral metagenome TaxID=1070528 RepID=A0A6M3K003_9ZZZZ